MPTAECIHIMNGHTAAVNEVAVTEDGNKTVSASSDVTVKVWNTDQKSRSVVHCIRKGLEMKHVKQNESIGSGNGAR